MEKRESVQTLFTLLLVADGPAYSAAGFRTKKLAMGFSLAASPFCSCTTEWQLFNDNVLYVCVCSLHLTYNTNSAQVTQIPFLIKIKILSKDCTTGYLGQQTGTVSYTHLTLPTSDGV